ncbi:MAG TPA: hypothetical protein VJ436_02275 [Anaerolineales bacterium]|nr:hypothetical protein [Anaerolineales bacterium]
MSLPERPLDLRLVLAVSAILWSLAAYTLAVEAVGRGVLFASVRWTAAVGLVTLTAGLSLGLLALAWTTWRASLISLAARALSILENLKSFNLLLFLLLVGLFVFLVLLPGNDFMQRLELRLAMFTSVTLAGAFFLKAYRTQLSWPVTLASAWILGGALYRAAAFIPEISTYPFSLGWSEASRYYYASLFFTERLYGESIPPSPLHPSRYLLQAIPFLVPGLPLWFHRLWQVLLWLGSSAAVIFGLARRVLPSGGSKAEGKDGPVFFGGRLSWGWLGRAVAMAWMFLFLFQGPVYYHLLVIPALVLWFFDARRFWSSLAVVFLASAWAGISRLNWFPVAGLLAAALYFLDNPRLNTGMLRLPKSRSAKSGDFDLHSSPLETSPDVANQHNQEIAHPLVYLLKPFAWVILGTLVAFAFQALYARWSGVDEGAFTSSFTSDLLWYRLLPNPTFPLGVLPAVLLVTGPLLILVYLGLRRLDWLRQLGLWSIPAVLFAGGVVVSVKIGGGSNLHNLDAFLMLLMVIAGYVFFGWVTPRPAEPASAAVQVAPPDSLARFLTGLVVLIPVVYALPAVGPLEHPDREKTEAALAKLQALVDDATGRGGEVLFISERHLLTFGMLPGVPLIGQYETVFLMEMAMAGNQTYLGQFYRDIGRQRFDLIVTDPLHDKFKGRAYPFGEENDVWVARVAQPVLSSYQRAEVFKGFGFEALEPKR